MEPLRGLCASLSSPPVNPRSSIFSEEGLTNLIPMIWSYSNGSLALNGSLLGVVQVDLNRFGSPFFLPGHLTMSPSHSVQAAALVECSAREGFSSSSCADLSDDSRCSFQLMFLMPSVHAYAGDFHYFVFICAFGLGLIQTTMCWHSECKRVCIQHFKQTELLSQ